MHADEFYLFNMEFTIQKLTTEKNTLKTKEIIKRIYSDFRRRNGFYAIPVT